MFHVTRGIDRTIQSVSRQMMPGSETLEEDSPEIQCFFKDRKEPEFDASDADFVRVLEDLIDTLILKNVLHHTELPTAAQNKLLVRKGLRSSISGSLNLFGEDDRIL